MDRCITKTVVTIDGVPSDKVIIHTATHRVLPVMISRSTVSQSWRLKNVTSGRLIDWIDYTEPEAIAAAIEYVERIAPSKRRAY